MLRREALLVLREICECIPNESAVSFVFLKPTWQTAKKKHSYRQYDLHMIMSLDKSTRENIESVARNHRLSVEESEGKLVFSAAKEIMEIVV